MAVYLINLADDSAETKPMGYGGPPRSARRFARRALEEWARGLFPDEEVNATGYTIMTVEGWHLEEKWTCDFRKYTDV